MTKIFSTNSLPILGGATGALTQTDLYTTTILPSSDIMIHTVVLAAIGAIVGYGLKMLLDYIVCICKKKKK